MKKAMLALAAMALAGCAVAPVASITNIDAEDVTVQVVIAGMFATATAQDVANAAQQEGERGCGRYGKAATSLSTHLIQQGSQYNSWRTVYQVIFTCG